MTAMSTLFARGSSLCALPSFVAVAFIAGFAGAQPADRAACVQAYESAQSLRAETKLRESRKQLLVCAADTCPSAVKGDCSVWLDQVEQSLPTVNFAVLDKTGKETTKVRISFDGVPLVDSLDGKSVAVDPGTHTFRFEIDGEPPTEQSVTIREGEKNRRVEASFVPRPGGGTPPVPGGDEKVPGPTESSGGLSPAFWVVGGVGVLGLGLFATFGGLGLSEKGDLEDNGCGKTKSCTDDDLQPIRTKFLVADISLGIGAAALVGAGIIGIVSLTSSESTSALPVNVGAAPLPNGGGEFVVSGTF